jgi:hypothetical protein
MKIFSTILVLLLLSGCSLFKNEIEDRRPDPVIIQNKTLLAYECPQAPQIDNVDLRDIKWDVVSRKELDALLLELMLEMYEGDDDPFEDEEFVILISIVNQAVGDLFFHPGEETRWSLSADDYADLGRNTSDIEAALKQLKSVIRHYKKCEADSKDIVRRANEQENAVVSDQE